MSPPTSPLIQVDGKKSERYCVLVLGKRAPSQDLETFRHEAVQRIEDQELPQGCTFQALSQAVARAYRNGEPAYDVLEEYLFADHSAAQAWAGNVARISVAAQSVVLLTQVVVLVEGPVAEQGLKHIELLTRRQGMTRQEFMSYWRDSHGPLAAAIPGVRRYHQLPTTDLTNSPGSASFDGMAILWFDSVDAMRGGTQHPAFRMTREDMPRLVNPNGTFSVLVQEVYSSGDR